MKRTIALALVSIFVAMFYAIPAAAQERGQCDADAPREPRRINHIADSVKEEAATVVVTLPCSNRVVVVKKCAITAMRKRNVQQFCYPDGKPAYFEYYDTMDYWDAPRQ